MFILCSDTDETDYDETLLLSVLSKFKLTSLEIEWDSRDEYIFTQLLQIASIQETLEDFRIEDLDASIYTSAVDLLVELKRIKTIWIRWMYKSFDELEEWKPKIKQFKKKLRMKHSEIEIDID